MLPQEYIDKVIDAADIVQVIGRYVNLKKEGSNFKGLSPFADEKTPSFVVSPAKQLFKDFSSGIGGNVVKFLMEKEALSFPHAVFHLGDMYNITRPEIDPEQEKKNEERKSAMDVLNMAHSVYAVGQSLVPHLG